MKKKIIKARTHARTHSRTRLLFFFMGKDSTGLGRQTHTKYTSEFGKKKLYIRGNARANKNPVLPCGHASCLASAALWSQPEWGRACSPGRISIEPSFTRHLSTLLLCFSLAQLVPFSVSLPCFPFFFLSLLPLLSVQHCHRHAERTELCVTDQHENSGDTTQKKREDRERGEKGCDILFRCSCEEEREQ